MGYFGHVEVSHEGQRLGSGDAMLTKDPGGPWWGWLRLADGVDVPQDFDWPDAPVLVVDLAIPEGFASTVPRRLVLHSVGSMTHDQRWQFLVRDVP